VPKQVAQTVRPYRRRWKQNIFRE